ncbi:FAD-dependent monooxygenase [Aminobacter sp. Piv2-1]|uniref:FAD-dependent monooxygenase n=1 Tax=Aminobacter sp. Piv2-1 TaxID=3031122 RepID=UPI0030988083
MRSRQVVIAGAGVAGLTAALAFARKGLGVRVLERAAALEEVGAGLQLSPNATRILGRLGVLDLVRPSTVRPEAIVLRDAASLKELARVPLGASAELRWQSPYLVAHRADLQHALLAAARQNPLIEISTGATVTGATVDAQAVEVGVEHDGNAVSLEAEMLVAADGVWSHSRRLVGPHERSRFAGELAWRTTIAADGETGRSFTSLGSMQAVTTFLHRGFHMVAYPIRAGTAINLVAFTPGAAIAEQWSGETDADALKRASRGSAPALTALLDQAGPWTVWPLHTVDSARPWTASDRIVLIGDAAHAMTPFAAQGAAMAIEDAYTLADVVASARYAHGLSQWEAARKARIASVARRGRLNHMAWHASGPVALARNLFLGIKSADSLAADMDWLYGWTPPGWSEAEL